MALPDAERRFGADPVLIARLEALEEPLLRQATVLFKGERVFGSGPFTIQQTPFGEGISLQPVADESTNVVGFIPKTMIVRTLANVLPDEKALTTALAEGFDGIMSIPTKEDFERPFELLLPAPFITRLDPRIYRRHPDPRSIERVAQKTRDAFSGAMPIGEFHAGDLKVRSNFDQAVVATLDAIRIGRFHGKLSDGLRAEIDAFIPGYRRGRRYGEMTPVAHIQMADAILTRIAESLDSSRH